MATEYKNRAIIAIVCALNTLEIDPTSLIREIKQKIPPVRWVWAELEDPKKLEGLTMEDLEELLNQLAPMNPMTGKTMLRNATKYTELVV